MLRAIATSYLPDDWEVVSLRRRVRRWGSLNGVGAQIDAWAKDEHTEATGFYSILKVDYDDPDPAGPSDIFREEISALVHVGFSDHLTAFAFKLRFV